MAIANRYDDPRVLELARMIHAVVEASDLGTKERIVAMARATGIVADVAMMAEGIGPPTPQQVIDYLSANDTFHASITGTLIRVSLMCSAVATEVICDETMNGP